MSDKARLEKQLENILSTEEGKKMLKEKLIEDKEFIYELAKEVMAVPAKNVGLSVPGTILDFFRFNWEEKV